MSQARRRPRANQARPRGAPLSPGDIAKAAGLKQFRDKAGYTQTELGKLLGVSQSALAEYENGKRGIPDDVFEGLLELAKAHAEAMTGGSGDGGAPGESPGSAAGPGDHVPPPPTGDTPPSIGFDQLAGGISAAVSMGLDDTQKKMAEEVQAFYELLGVLVGQVSAQGGGIIYQDSPALAAAAVAAAAESLWIRRFVEAISQGPVFAFFVVHALTAMKVNTAMQTERRHKRELEAMAAQPGPRAPVVVVPPQGADAVDPIDSYRQAV